jgi:glycosyltransferase involved in cell wall biosynthesis
MTLPPARDAASRTLLALLTAAPGSAALSHVGGCAIVVLPPAAPGMARSPAGPAPGAGALRRLGAPLLLAARMVLRRPRVRQLALHILKRSPGLYARAYRMMMASTAAPAARADAAGDRADTLSPRANAILHTLRTLRDAAPRQAGARPRLAFVSPLPPARTGVAVYAIELLAELSSHVEIELVVAQPEVVLPPALAHLPVRQAAWFAEHGAEYDEVLYQFGNSPFHSHMFALLARHPGVVVLHDFFLGGALVHAQMSGADPRAWGDALLYSHGYAAVRASQTGDGRAQAHKDWPCSLPVLDNATRTIVHSRHARQLAADWFGPEAAWNIDVIPHPRTPPATIDRVAARAALGIPEDCFLVCSFGFVAPNKLTHELLRAWLASSLHLDRRCALVLAGANHDSPYGVEVEALIRSAGPQANIRIAGWLDDAAYRQYLQAADVGVQLRTNAHGESSGAVLDCMNYALPTIVNANGSMAEFPPDAVWRLPDAFEVGELSAALEALRGDPARRRTLGARAVALLDAGFRPAHCARLYRETLDRARADTGARRQALQQALTDAPTADDDALRALAEQLARAPARPGRRQLLVDITGWADDTASDSLGLSQLLELLAQHDRGMHVEPVRLVVDGRHTQYRYARKATGRLLGLAWHQQDEPPVDVAAGDVFYASDALSPAVTAALQTRLFDDWRARGVVVHLLVRALSAGEAGAAAHLGRLAAHVDQLLCLSEAAAQQLAQALRGGAIPEVLPAAAPECPPGGDVVPDKLPGQQERRAPPMALKNAIARRAAAILRHALHATLRRPRVKRVARALLARMPGIQRHLRGLMYRHGSGAGDLPGTEGLPPEPKIGREAPPHTARIYRELKQAQQARKDRCV